VHPHAPNEALAICFRQVPPLIYPIGRVTKVGDFVDEFRLRGGHRRPGNKLFTVPSGGELAFS
jgi:hypothetical protein